MEPDHPTSRSGTEPVVHLRGAVALLGRFPALAGVDLDVDRRRIVLLRGANGAGKTTFFNVLTGLYKPTSGAVIFDDVNRMAYLNGINRKIKSRDNI